MQNIQSGLLKRKKILLSFMATVSWLCFFLAKAEQKVVEDWWQDGAPLFAARRGGGDTGRHNDDGHGTDDDDDDDNDNVGSSHLCQVSTCDLTSFFQAPPPEGFIPLPTGHRLENQHVPLGSFKGQIRAGWWGW